MAKERNIPKTVVRGKTLWSRKHIDNALADKQPTETATDEWYSVEEVCAKFNMSKEAVYRFVSELWLKAAGITKRITFHRFRDTYATLQLAAGTEIYTVSKMLDHANANTTQIYARLVDSTKRDTINRIKLV